MFGGTGPAGQLVIDQALASGHEVVAYARSPQKLAARARLTVIAGELDDAEAIARAVSGADAVISLLGPGAKLVEGQVTQGTTNIVQAMEQHGVRRLVALATPSATDPKDESDFRFKVLVAAIRLFVPAAYREIRATADVVRAARCDWTLVRVPFLTNEPSTGKPRVGYLGRGHVGVMLSRHDLATFMLGQLESMGWVGRSPVVSS